MISPSASSRSVPLHRNGRTPACEPCRKRKMACDYTLPACQRCRKKKQELDCIYIQAPMTRRSPTQSITSPRSVMDGRLDSTISNPSTSLETEPQADKSCKPNLVREPSHYLNPEPRSSTLFSTTGAYLGA